MIITGNCEFLFNEGVGIKCLSTEFVGSDIVVH